ncbi:MAG: hypothetical protein AAFR64_11630 [Pseudomonadota bacterium]
MPLRRAENRRLGLPVGIAAACAVLLSACSVSSPLAVSSSRPEASAGLTAGAAIALETADNPSSLRGRFAAALSQEFADNAITLDPDAALLADFSIAQSDASGGILRGEGKAVENEEEQDWAAAPREDRTFDECEAQRLRASFVIYSRAQGTVTYRGTVEAIECRFDDATLAEFAASLVKDALARP